MELEVIAQSEEKPMPWRRYFARHLDMTLTGLLATILCVFVGQTDLTNVSPLALAFFLAFVSTLLEALCLAFFGNTPGKYLLGLCLASCHPGPLTSSQAFKRSFAVWAIGLGFNLPVVSFVTMILAYRKMKSAKPAAWDLFADTVIKRRSRHPAH